MPGALIGADQELVDLVAEEVSQWWVPASLALALGLALFLGWRFFRLRMGTPRPARLALYAVALLAGGFFAAGGSWRWADERDRKTLLEDYQRRLASEEAERRKALMAQVHAMRVHSRLPARTRLLRLTPAGDVDPSFSVSGFEGTISGVLAQPDERVLVTGAFDYLVDGPDPKVARGVIRLLSDGRPDEPFILAPRPGGYASWVALGAGGRILLGLTGSTVPVARLEPSGAADESFRLPAIQRAPPSWPVLHGSGEALESLYARDFLARFDSVPLRAALQPDGRLLVVGRFTSVGGSVTLSGAARFESGRLDDTFASDGANPIDYVPVPLANGTLVALSYGYRRTVVMGPDGRLDEERTQTLARAVVECVGLLERAEADNRGGFFGAGKRPPSGNGTLARFTPDLACDRSFKPRLSGTAVTALAPLPGGGVLVATYP